jgi:hypothetical protein
MMSRSFISRAGTVRTATETIQDAVYLHMLSIGSSGVLRLAHGIAEQAGAPAPRHLGAAELFDWALSLRGYPRDAPYWDTPPAPATPSSNSQQP